MKNPFCVATEEFNRMSFEEQSAVLDSLKFSKVRLTQEQIDAQVERCATIKQAQEHFERMAQKLKLGTLV
jgi:hypothetical protein